MYIIYHSVFIHIRIFTNILLINLKTTGDNVTFDSGLSIKSISVIFTWTNSLIFLNSYFFFHKMGVLILLLQRYGEN